MTRVRRKLFSEPIGDEINLEALATRLIKNRECPLDYSGVLHLMNMYGINTATRTYYESLVNSERGKIKGIIDKIQINRESIRKITDGKIIIVPGMFYKEHPEVGADGGLITEIAKHYGFETEILPIKSKGRITDNTYIIEHSIKRTTHKNVWLISLSKGSSEVRHYLQTGTVPDNVKGWVNISGILNGSHHANRRLSTVTRRLLYWVICQLMRVEYKVIEELKTDHAIWKNSNWDTSMSIIHILPMPLRSHLQPMLVRKYEKISHLGPNDGIVLLTDVNDVPGDVYPVWGADHFMRTHEVSALLYKIFAYITEQLIQPHNQGMKHDQETLSQRDPTVNNSATCLL